MKRHLGAAVLVWLLLVAGSGMSRIDSFDYDEGLEVMKARLVWQGFSLYRDVWCDQPPLLTWLLAPVTALDGDRVVLPRLVVSLFLVLLLVALQGLVGRGRWSVAALVVALWSVACLYVVRLSVSVMFGLPSLALSVWACWEAQRSREGGGLRRLFLSAVAMVAGILTKLWVAPCVLVVLVVWLVPPEKGGRPCWREACLWSGLVCLGVCLGLGFWSGELWQQLVVPHVSARLRAANAQLNFEGLRAWLTFAPHLVPLAGTLVLLKLRGAVVPWRRLAAPTCWFAGAVVIACVHRPYWYHHSLFMTVPLLWILGVLWETLRTSGSWPGHWSPSGGRRLGAVVVVLAVLVWGWGIRAAVRSFRGVRAGPPHAVVSALRSHAGDEGVVLSDTPMWVYRAGLRTPPYWAVLSSKRISLPGQGFPEITAWIAEHRPEQVLLARWRVRPGLESWLDEHYVSVPLHRRGRLWVRPDLRAPH